jgi:hypothetical protein
MIRLQTTITFVLLVISKLFNVAHPLVLKYAIDSITMQDTWTRHQTYMLVGAYAGLRFLADFTNYIREIPFANVSASAEVYIAHLVYNHV